MSTKQNAILRCNRCEAVFETEIWTEIIAGEDFKLDKEIFNDELNFFECDECGNIGLALYPVKIRDKESNDKAMVIPIIESFDMVEDEEVVAMGFSVLEVTDKEPCAIFYSFGAYSAESFHLFRCNVSTYSIPTFPHNPV